jgi:hypothetical protein
MKSILLISLLMLCGSVASGQTCGNPAQSSLAELKLKELASLPQGLSVVHNPSPVGARYAIPDQYQYKWFYGTSVSSSVGPVTIEEFGCFSKRGDLWLFATLTGKPYTAQHFSEWYNCPDSILKPGSKYTDETNWSAANCLQGGASKWYYIGIDPEGNRFKGEAVVELLAELAE